MSSSTVVCGVVVPALESENGEAGQTHFVPGFGDPQRRNWRESDEEWRQQSGEQRQGLRAWSQASTPAPPRRSA